VRKIPARFPIWVTLCGWVVMSRESLVCLNWELCAPNKFPRHADVAELADAQVSEACDGDIVEVQVLSSAPAFRKKKRLHLTYRDH
jgi:hypothetical protein